MNDDYEPQPHEILKQVSWELAELNRKVERFKKEEALDFIGSVEAMHNGLADEISRTNANLEALIDKMPNNKTGEAVRRPTDFDWRGADFAILFILIVIVWRVW